MSKICLPLWLALSLPFAVVLMLVFAILMASHQRSVTRLIDEAGANLLNASSDHVHGRLKQYLELPFQLQTLLTDCIVRQKMYEPGDISRIQTYLNDIFKAVYIPNFKQFEMLQIGTKSGEFSGIHREPQGATSLSLKDNRTDDKLVYYQTESTEVRETIDKYDPRVRPWYRPVAQSLQPRWSSLYMSKGLNGIVAISATAPVLTPTGELLGVISTDVSLTAMAEFLKATPLYEKYKSALIYIVDEKGQLIAQTIDADAISASETGKSQTILMADHSNSPLVRASYAQLPPISPSWSASPKTTASILGSNASKAPLSFKLEQGDEHYFGQYIAYTDPRGLNWRLVALVSENELSGDARQSANLGLLAALALTTFGLGVGFWIVKRIALPIQETAEAASRVASESDTGLINMRPSSILETAMLTNAFNAMSQRIQKQLRNLHDLAMNDTTTGLLNHQGLLAAAQWDIPRDLVLVLLGIDNFKMVNSSLGPKTGDYLLRQIANRLHAHCPQTSLLARISGDEFMVLLPDVHLAVHRESLIQSVCAVFSTPFQTATDEVTLRASMGVVSTCATGKEVDTDLLQQASLALRTAKARGHSQRVNYESALLNQALATAHMVADLKIALAQSELRVYFQPIIDLKTEKICGLEALVRWQSNTRGMINPCDFIPIAEESGQIVELGNWVMLQATTEVAQLIQDNGLDDHFTLHVNVSVRQLVQADFAKTVAQAIARSGIPARSLMVEITESVLMKEDSSTLKTIADIRALGVRIALDDFGTGYSSLSYLNQFHFHSLKIDRSFIVAAEKSERSQTILKAVVDITRGLGLEAVAEGIETREQAQMLRDFGCAYAQGYLFGRPAPLDQIWAASNTNDKAYTIENGPKSATSHDTTTMHTPPP